ncbi:hypothetical protein BKP45_04870 [Anaerobacillus alkalidiazotrophicus]|uniref:ArpU family transcriptional regulator n=2 Tax=Anaerobacillus alkalidiazotrophicus TaxID=472963 RepID=A0A1S2MB77_9BACI|nr:hypothetical protein BKP45_04870 [Anaerobacillus alkalidiazotrophicus]
MSSNLLRNDILEEIKNIDHDTIYIQTTSFTHTPTNPTNCKSSIIEINVIDREEARNRFYYELLELDRFVTCFRAAFSELSPSEHQIIHLCYMSVLYDEDYEIASFLDLDFRQFQAAKKKALYNLYSALISPIEKKNHYEYTFTLGDQKIVL